MENISTQLSSLAITRSLILQRVANNLSKEVAQAYLSVIDDVTKQLKSGDDVNIKNVNKIIKELQSRMEVNLDIESDLTKLGMSEAQWAQSSVNGAVGIDLMSKLPTEATIAKIVGDSYIEGATINEWFNGVNDSMKNDLKKSVRVGMLEGETTIQIAKRVRDSLGVSLNHADSISRTAVATVSNNARMATYEANDDVIKGYEHLSAIDNRTSVLCSTKDGAAWDLQHNGINAKGKKYPYKVPPLHFRCRSTLSIILKSYEELGLMGIDIPEGTRSSMDGSVSSSTTFEKWFESKDSKFQEKYLGKQRYEMFKAGKITFNDLVGQNGMTLTIKELGMIDKGVIKVPKVLFDTISDNEVFNSHFKDIKDERIVKIVNSMPTLNKKYDQSVFKNNNFSLDIGKKGSQYDMWNRQLSISSKDVDSMETVLHEYGHFIDNTMMVVSKYGKYPTAEIQVSMGEDIKLLALSNKSKQGKEQLLSIFNSIDGANNHQKSDILDAFASGYIFDSDIGAGHGKKYYKGLGQSGAETFANLFALKARGVDMEDLKQYFPSTISKFEEILTEASNAEQIIKR